MTKIYSADIIIGNDSEVKTTLHKQPVKRLPQHVLFSDDYFLQRLILQVGEKRWLAYKMDRITQLPKIKINYLQHIGNVENEPIIQ